MKFFTGSLFASIIGAFSIISIGGLFLYGHITGMRADVAISCFVGLISLLVASMFMSFIALAQEIIRHNSRQ